jgi:hypothetical protein
MELNAGDGLKQPSGIYTVGRRLPRTRLVDLSMALVDM